MSPPTAASRAAGGPLAAVGLATILGLSMGSLVPIGFARFAYALLLPAMRADLGWSYAEAGLLNSANAAGHLVGAIVMAAWTRRLGARRGFLLGLLITALALLGAGLTADLTLLLVSRAVAGWAGALAFLCGGVLAAQAGIGLPRARQSLYVFAYFGGGGTGIVLSSVLVPLALEAGGWAAGWLAMGGLSVASVLLAAVAARRVDAAPASAAARAAAGGPQVSLVPLFACYFLFGAGYIAYMTFIVAFLRQAGASATLIGAFWAVLGLASLAAGFGWGAIFARLTGGRAMALVLIVNAAGSAVPLLAGGIVASFASALLVGATVMASPSAGTDIVRKCRPEAEWAPVLGRLTILFGIGQSLGPLLAGALADGPLGMTGGLGASVAILGVAALVSLLQREPPAGAAT